MSNNTMNTTPVATAKIGDRLRAKRKELNMTQLEVAKRIGLAKQTVNRYETGVIPNIPLATVKKLAAVLDTTPSYLMGWDAEHFDDEATPTDIPPMIISIANNYDLLSPEKKTMFESLITALFPELLG